MFVDEISTRESLSRMVRKVTANRALREDLLQEGLVHLWITEVGRPGQTKSWYLQSCKYHLLHYLAAGRSVDSGKRRNGYTRFEENSESHDDLMEEMDSGESVFGLVSVRDIIALLLPLLNVQEQLVLECFADGLRLREIGRRLKMSHTMVIRHRRKIALLLTRLEKPRPANLLKNGFTHNHFSKSGLMPRKLTRLSPQIQEFEQAAAVRI
jgi:RNA polymerase sigma factor (sigma-70 family)